MPSLRHHGLVELVHQSPKLAVELVHLTGAFPLPDDVEAKLGSEDTSDAAPPDGNNGASPQEYTADAVVVVSDKRTGERLVAIIVEPQGEDDDDKDTAWPCYVTNARRANKVPAATLIVLCWSKATAAKCRRVIRTGHRGFDLAPHVIGPGDEPNPATTSPYLSICFTLLHQTSLNTDEGRHRVLRAIRDTHAKQSDHKALSRIILGLASPVSRKRLEELMAITYRSDFIDKWTEKGLAEGRAETKAKDLLEVLEVRGLRPTDQQRDKVTSSKDLDELATWFRRALTASTADEVFKD